MGPARWGLSCLRMMMLAVRLREEERAARPRLPACPAQQERVGKLPAVSALR